MLAPIKHSCKPHTYQDKKYNGQRIFVDTVDGNLRCTVCNAKQNK